MPNRAMIIDKPLIEVVSDLMTLIVNKPAQNLHHAQFQADVAKLCRSVAKLPEYQEQLQAQTGQTHLH